MKGFAIWTAALVLAAPALFAQGKQKVGFVEKTKDGKTVKREKVEESKTHSVLKGVDTLWGLADHYYNDPWQWPRIYEANKDKVKDPHWIYPGQQFIIPGLDVVVEVVKVNEPPKPEPKPEPVEEPMQPEPVALPEVKKRPLESIYDELPPDQTSGFSTSERIEYPMTWEEDGVVASAGGENDFFESYATKGDTVHIKVTRGHKLEPGTMVTIYKRAGYATKESMFLTKKVKQYLEYTARARVVSSDGRRAEALVTEFHNAISDGDIIKIEDHGPAVK